MSGAGSKGTATGERSQAGRFPDISLNQEDVIMLNYDLSPFYRSTVGFDRLLAMLDKAVGAEQNAPSYPPYNIERTGENAYRITLAVAGFGEKRAVGRDAREHADGSRLERGRGQG